MQVGTAGAASGPGVRVEQAIRTGSSATGVSYDYLQRTAYRESSYRPDLAATTSTATGLFQFLDQTWLGLIKTEGPSVGLGAAADAISRDRSGRYDVADPAAKARILALRKDPTVAAVMAGKFTRQNQTAMTAALGRVPSEGELYAGHVLGPSGGTKLIQLAGTDPGAAAASYFPEAAASNRAIFYSADGTPKSAADVYAFLTREGDVPSPAATAGTAGTPARAARPSAGTPDTLNPLATLIAAQTAGDAQRQPLAFSLADPATARRSLDTSVAQLGIPGDAKTAKDGGGVTGWRAKRAGDAFSALMRSDAADLAADPPVDLMALGSGAGAASMSRLLPGLAGLQGSSAVSAYAPTGAAAATQALGGAAISGAAIGGAGVGGAGSGAGGVRRSRILTDAMRAAGGGAPAQPLPMVTDQLGVMRPSRFSAAALVAGDTGRPVSAASAVTASASLAAGSIGGEGGRAAEATATLRATAPLPASPGGPVAGLGTSGRASNGATPLLPPVPGEAGAPLDLVAAARLRR
jgi:hypothetical protein